MGCLRGSGSEGGVVLEQKAGAVAGLGGLVVGVVEGAFFEGEAAAADAAAEAGVGFLEEIDLGGDAGLDAGGDGLPVFGGGGLVAGEGCEFGFDFGDGEAEFLGDQGEGEAADVGAGEAALVASAA